MGKKTQETGQNPEKPGESGSKAAKNKYTKIQVTKSLTHALILLHVLGLCRPSLSVDGEADTVHTA
jgi:hypothetical protein